MKLLDIACFVVILKFGFSFANPVKIEESFLKVIFLKDARRTRSYLHYRTEICRTENLRPGPFSILRIFARKAFWIKYCAHHAKKLLASFALSIFTLESCAPGLTSWNLIFYFSP